MDGWLEFLRLFLLSTENYCGREVQTIIAKFETLWQSLKQIFILEKILTKRETLLQALMQIYKKRNKFIKHNLQEGDISNLSLYQEWCKIFSLLLQEPIQI